MNQMLLTAKNSEASHGQQVVNRRPRSDMKGQVWKWKEGYIVSQLNSNLVLDGSFGKVSINDKKHGNIYQKWRHIACYTKLNIVLGDRTQIIKIGLDSIINYFIYTII